MNTSLRNLPAAFLAATLLLAGSLPALAAVLEVAEVSVEGNVLRVSVSNTTNAAQSGTVVARVALENETTVLVVPVQLEEGQKVFVEIHAPSTIEGVIQLGVVLDDGSPF